MRVDSLPSQYIPFPEVYLLDNHLVNVKILFTINDHVPLLIGRGKTPRIWLSIPADATGEKWQPLVRDNRSLHPKVTITGADNKIKIETPDGIVLEVEKTSEDIAKIHNIDLRPFGINIYGKEDLLTVMNTTLSGNSFVNVQIMIDIGGKKKES